jgi:hypothetical protein
MAPPNVDFGFPAIFFDSHPEEQASYLYSVYNYFKSTFHIAWTGQVPKPLEHGMLRLIFWTEDDTQGMKDFELHEYATVREAYEEALRLDEVRRVMVMGFSGQNPYIYTHGKNPWVERFEREKRARANGQRMDQSKENRAGKRLDINEIIAQSDELEEERRLKFEREKPKEFV